MPKQVKVAQGRAEASLFIKDDGPVDFAETISECLGYGTVTLQKVLLQGDGAYWVAYVVGEPGKGGTYPQTALFCTIKIEEVG